MHNNQVWARFHASLGLKVFPCDAGGSNPKKPLVAGGFKAASSNADQIDAWWKTFPNAAVGLALRAGEVVIDLDLKPEKGIDGTAALREKIGEQQLHELFEQALVVRTPSGGWHLYISPTSCELWRTCQNVNGLVGVDLRVGGSSYVIAPGTIMADGGAYQWFH